MGRTRQGKARPWVLISGVMIAITGCLLYAVPQASYQVQIVWIVVSYNLFTGLPIERCLYGYCDTIKGYVLFILLLEPLTII